MSQDLVIEGRDGWLFLAEGTNQSISQITGAKDIAESDLYRWIRILQFRRSRFGDRYRTLICPEKSAVLAEYLPDAYSVSPRRPSAKIRNNVPDVIYPHALLRDSAEFDRIYPKTDTHFSDIGAAVVAEHVVKSYGLDPADAFSDAKYDEISMLGDLGVKLPEQRRSRNFKEADSPAVASKDNGLRNRGRITRYTNRVIAASGRPTLLLFGDSFSAINLAKSLCRYFSEVHFVHSGSIDYMLTENLQPDYILCEYAERFVLNAPVEALSLTSVVTEKLVMQLYDEKMLSDFAESLDEFGEYLSCAERDHLKHLLRAA